MTKNNLTSIDGKGKKSEMRDALNMILKNMDELLELNKVKSEYKKNYYDHLIKQGFSDNQALEIVKSDTTI